MGTLVTQADEKQAPTSRGETGSESSLGARVRWNKPAPTGVLLLTDSFSPHAGGSREYYAHIYRELVGLGAAKVVVLTKKVPGWEFFDKEHSSASFRIHRRFKPLKSWKYQELPKGIFPFIEALWRILRDRPRVIHAGDLYPPGVIAWLINKLTGIPYVIYSHGEEITQTDHFRYQPRVRDCIYKRAAAVVANSEFTRKQLLRIGINDDRIVKITPGVDATRFRPEPANEKLIARYGLAGKTVVLSVGRLVPRKGHRAALEAFARICREFPDAHYVIAGVGPEEQSLRYLTEHLGLQGRVTFTGLVPAENLPDIYNLCHIMLLANQQQPDGDVEGFGIVFIEASATGKPVIGGRSGGTSEAVLDGVTGFLVNPQDSTELADALRQLLRNPALRQRLGAEGRRRVESEFDWRRRAQRLHEVNCRVVVNKRDAHVPQTERGPVHVLFVIDQLCESGGAERAILQTIRLLPPTRFRSSLITFRIDENLEIFRDLPCPHFVYPLHRTYDWNALQVARKVRKFIREERVDIVHTFHETADLWAGLVSQMKDGPALVSSRRDMGILRTPKHRLAYRLMRSRFDLVLTVSEQVRRYCIENDGLPEAAVATLYNGVELASFKHPNGLHALYKQFSIETEAPVVLTVGHIREVKGIDVLVKVAARVALEVPKVRFVIVGGHADSQYFESIQRQIAELGIEQNIRFVGRTENVASFLKMGSVFFLPSRSEGFSNALIEAMASGLPCVATRVGGNAEAIEEGSSGFIVENEDVEGAANRILRLLREPTLAKAMGAAGKEVVKTKFTAQVMIDQLVGHYDHLLAGRHQKNVARL